MEDALEGVLLNAARSVGVVEVEEIGQQNGDRIWPKLRWEAF